MDYLKTLKVGDPLTMLVNLPQGGVFKPAMNFQETAQKEPKPVGGSGSFTKMEMEQYREQNERAMIRNIMKEREDAIALAQPLLEQTQRVQSNKTDLMTQMVRKALETGMLRDVEKLVRAVGTEESKAKDTEALLRRYESLPPDVVREVYGSVAGRSRDAEARQEPVGKLEHQFKSIRSRELGADASATRELAPSGRGTSSLLLELKEKLAGRKMAKPKPQRDTEMLERLLPSMSPSMRRQGISEAEESKSPETEVASAFTLPSRPRVMEPSASSKPQPPSRTASVETADPTETPEGQKRFSEIKRTLPTVLTAEQIQGLSSGSRSKLRAEYIANRLNIPAVLQVQQRGRKRKE